MLNNKVISASCLVFQTKREAVLKAAWGMTLHLISGNFLKQSWTMNNVNESYFTFMFSGDPNVKQFLRPSGYECTGLNKFKFSASCFGVESNVKPGGFKFTNHYFNFLKGFMFRSDPWTNENNSMNHSIVIFVTCLVLKQRWSVLVFFCMTCRMLQNYFIATLPIFILCDISMYNLQHYKCITCDIKIVHNLRH